MLMLKAGVLRPARLVSLAKLRINEIRVYASGLHVGAMTRLRDLERSPEVRKGWPVIARALKTLSNVRVRNVATVGGATPVVPVPVVYFHFRRPVASNGRPMPEAPADGPAP